MEDLCFAPSWYLQNYLHHHMTVIHSTFDSKRLQTKTASGSVAGNRIDYLCYTYSDTVISNKANINMIEQ